MIRITTLALSIAVLTGCVFVDDGYSPPHHHDVVVVTPNSAPYIYDGFSGCSFDRYSNDDVWSFEADVGDADGVYDVVQVWADVYDDYDGSLVQSFELYPTDTASVWYSDWLVGTTYLDCWYGGYTVDLVAYDTYDAAGALTIFPDTYR